MRVQKAKPPIRDWFPSPLTARRSVEAYFGLVGDAEKPGILYVISDSIYGHQLSFYTIDTTKKPAPITSVLCVKCDGIAAQKFDIESITL